MSIKALLTRILNSLTFSVEVVEGTETTIGAGTTSWININTAKSGKKPIAVTGYYLIGDYGYECSVYCIQPSSIGNYIAVYNGKTHTAKITPRLYVLYQKA